MKATVCTKYGSPEVLQVQEVVMPMPKENEILVKIHASSVTAADGMMREGSPFWGRIFIGLTKPKNPVTGTGFAGTVEATGSNVTRFKKGDDVFGESLFGAGTNAEYVCVAEDGILTTMPDNISYQEAAVICDGAVTSLNFLHELANIEKGHKVLINGASGSLGTAAVQIAKHFGAEVTGVCSSGNIEMVKSIGADYVVDYTKQDFTANGESYDIVYDTLGIRSFGECKKMLTPKGIYLSPVLSMRLVFQMMWTSMFGAKKAKFSATGVLPVEKLKELLKEVKDIVMRGNLKSVIDRSYPLEEIVDAHRYVSKGHKKGNVVISL